MIENVLTITKHLSTPTLPYLLCTVRTRHLSLRNQNFCFRIAIDQRFIYGYNLFDETWVILNNLKQVLSNLNGVENPV